MRRRTRTVVGLVAAALVVGVSGGASAVAGGGQAPSPSAEATAKDARAVATIDSVGVADWPVGLQPGAQQTWYWNNANPLDRVYVVGFSPHDAKPNIPCQYEVMRSWYLQRLNEVPGGGWTPEREFWFTIKNVGTIACSADVLLGAVAT